MARHWLSDIDKRAASPVPRYRRNFVLVLSPLEESRDSVAEMRRSLLRLPTKADIFVPSRHKLFQGVSAPRDVFADMTKTSELIHRNVHFGIAPITNWRFR
jgi:hypothetical protein